MAIFRSPILQMRRNFDKLTDEQVQIARKVLIATAADARKSIQASLKSGGKNRFSKTYRTSKPGEPPLTHGTRLKRSIRYEITNSNEAKIGAPSLSGRRTARILEEGGGGKASASKTSDAYYAQRQSRARAVASRRRRLLKSGATLSQAPKTKRAYYLESVSGRFRKVTTYEYFKSEAAARRAMAAPEFRRWRATVQKTVTETFRVAARPFVAPGVEKELETQRRRERWERIARKLRRD